MLRIKAIIVEGHGWRMRAGDLSSAVDVLEVAHVRARGAGSGLWHGTCAYTAFAAAVSAAGWQAQPGCGLPRLPRLKAGLQTAGTAEDYTRIAGAYR
jgi:hypothetical protein